MHRRIESLLAINCFSALAAVGCGGDDQGSANRGQGGATAASLGTELRFEVERDVPSLVQLSSARVIAADGDPRTSSDWDLAFQGWEVSTNGGVSGLGQGAAFGPLPFTYFVAGEDPTDVPFLIKDKAGGAFRSWYLYDGGSHALYSRFHRFGVRRGARFWKLQILGYYGEVQGAPISGLYQLRYAEVTPDGSRPIVLVSDLDARGGGLEGDSAQPATCLSLDSGEQRSLTDEAALRSHDWDLCFRRDAVRVNGELSGPAGVTAVDLDAASTSAELPELVKARTRDSEAAAFEAVDYATLSAPTLEYRGDQPVSVFTDQWIDRSQQPPALAQDSNWLVVGADGQSRYLVALTGLEHSTAEAAGTVVLRVRQVR
jgi:hypothetical protein